MIQYECQDCDLQMCSESLLPVQDLEQRVAPGEPVPAGQCPACGALCHAKGPFSTLDALRDAVCWVDALWPDSFDDAAHEARCEARKLMLDVALEEETAKQARTTYATTEELDRARDLYCNHSDDDIEVDEEEVRTSETEDGKWVQAWLWLPKPDEDEEEEEEEEVFGAVDTAELELRLLNHAASKEGSC